MTLRYQRKHFDLFGCESRVGHGFILSPTSESLPVFDLKLAGPVGDRMRVFTFIALEQAETIAVALAKPHQVRIECMAQVSLETSAAPRCDLADITMRLSQTIEELDKAGFLLAAAHAETALWAFLTAWSSQSNSCFDTLTRHG